MWPFKKKHKEEAPVQVAQEAPKAVEAVDFNPELLNKQMKAVYKVVKNGKWITLADLSAKANASEASVSARLRDFRKPQYGSMTVERRHVKGTGRYEYRLVEA